MVHTPLGPPTTVDSEDRSYVTTSNNCSWGAFYDDNSHSIRYGRPQEAGRTTEYERPFSRKAAEDIMRRADPAANKMKLIVYGGRIWQISRK
jgi:hypothetical protein